MLDDDRRRRRRAALDVDCDAYPYAAGSNPLKNLLPPWVQAGGVAAMLARLAPRRNARADPRRDRRATASTIGAASRPGTACRSRSRRTCRNTPGEPSAQLAASAAHDPIDALCDYLIDDKGATRVLITSICEDDIRDIVALADGAGRLRRQLRRDLRHGQPGHAAPALLRHLPAHHRALRRASSSICCRSKRRSTR